MLIEPEKSTAESGKAMVPADRDGISIVVPTLEEADNIEVLLQRIFQLRLNPERALEVIVVDAESTDDTAERVSAWEAEHPVRLISLKQDGGLATAVLAGARSARYQWVVVMDADLSHPPEMIPELAGPAMAGQADVVIGSRYIDGGSTPDWPLTRKLCSRLAAIPARLFTDVADPMAGFFCVSRERLVQLRDDIPGFKIGLELLAQGGDRLRVLELPIAFHDRVEGRSKMNCAVMVDYLRQLGQLAGLEIEAFSWRRLLGLAVLGTMIDYLLFILLLRVGVPPVAAGPGGIGLSSILLFFGFASFWRGGHPGRGVGGPQLLVGAYGLAAALALQGGVYQLLRDYLGLGVAQAFLPASALGVLCFSATVCGYGFIGSRRAPPDASIPLAAAGIILFSILVRAVYLGLPELLEQEAYYWNYSQHLAGGYLEHPPLVALLIWFGCWLLGVSELGVRWGTMLCWVITATYLYRLSSRLYGGKAALGAVLLLAALPFYFGTGLVITPDAPLLAAWSALLFYLYRTCIERRGGWLGAGVALGLGLLAEYSVLLLATAGLFFLVFDSRARRNLSGPGPYFGLLLALLLFVPVLVWNYQQDWASLLFLKEQWLGGGNQISTQGLGGYLLLILTPAGLAGAGYFICGGAGAAPRAARGNGAGGEGVRGYRFLLTMLLMPLVTALVFSLFREVKLNWTAPYWLALLPFLGYTVTGGETLRHSRLLRLVNRSWRPTLVVLFGCYLAILYHAGLGIPGVAFPAKPFLTGWDQLAAEVEHRVEEAAQRTGSRPVVIGMNPYQITSGLAFYRAKNRQDAGAEIAESVRETLGWHLFGWDSLMYRYWADPRNFLGRNILVVATGKVRAEYPYFRGHISRMDPIEEFELRKNQEPVRSFYFRLLYEYRPNPLPAGRAGS